MVYKLQLLSVMERGFYEKKKVIKKPVIMIWQKVIFKLVPTAIAPDWPLLSSGSRIDLRGGLDPRRGWPGPKPKNPMKKKEFSQNFPKLHFFTVCRRGRGG